MDDMCIIDILLKEFEAAKRNKDALVAAREMAPVDQCLVIDRVLEVKYKKLCLQRDFIAAACEEYLYNLKDDNGQQKETKHS